MHLRCPPCAAFHRLFLPQPSSSVFRLLFHPRPSSSSLDLPLAAEAFCYTVSMAFSDYPFQRHSRNVTVIAPPQHDLKGTGRYFITMVTAPRRACLGEVTAPEWVEWSPEGRCVDRCLRQMCVRFPIVIDEMAIMPDHIHLCIRVKEALGRSILLVLSGMRRVAEKEACALEGRYTTLWERKYRVFLACSYESYGRCLEYTEANPRRWWLTRHAPEDFRVKMVQHVALPMAYRWQAVGNIALLDAPWMMVIVVHRVDSSAVIAEKKRLAIEVAKAGGVIVGGFVAPAEKEILKCVYAEVPEVKVISFVPHTLTDYKPPARAIDGFRCGRRLLLSSVPEHAVDAPCQRQVCLRHNAIAEKLAGESAAGARG